MLLYYLAFPFLLIISLIYPIFGAIATLLDRSGGLYTILFRQWSRIILGLLRVQVTTRGAEKLDPNVDYVFIANHASYLDIPALVLSLPNRVAFVLKEELTRIPIWGWSLRLSPHIVIRRTDPRDALGTIERTAEQVRRGGTSVIVFPEGTRSADGRLGEFKRGAFMLATKTGVTLVPVAIRGSHLLLPRNDWRVRPGRIEVIVGEPIASHVGLNRAEERAIQSGAYEQLERMLEGERMQSSL